MNRVVGWELSFTEDFVVIPTVDLEIQLFVGLVMVDLTSCSGEAMLPSSFRQNLWDFQFL
ncbi:hypothetical protein [Leptospira interrogans]|uniref:hypothetical protein n=1 Tax=Leptospira interrogans TaxID=173 RepID=UPI0012FA74E8|nr:hypothetical protein [Leptospira interrogans]